MPFLQSLGPSVTTLLVFFGVLTLSLAIVAVAFLEDY